MWARNAKGSNLAAAVVAALGAFGSACDFLDLNGVFGDAGTVSDAGRADGPVADAADAAPVIDAADAGDSTGNDSGGLLEGQAGSDGNPGAPTGCAGVDAKLCEDFDEYDAGQDAAQQLQMTWATNVLGTGSLGLDDQVAWSKPNSAAMSVSYDPSNTDYSHAYLQRTFPCGPSISLRFRLLVASMSIGAYYTLVVLTFGDNPDQQTTPYVSLALDSLHALVYYPDADGGMPSSEQPAIIANTWVSVELTITAGASPSITGMIGGQSFTITPAVPYPTSECFLQIGLPYVQEPDQVTEAVHIDDVVVDYP
jgi:hypothetical protein